MLHDAAATDHRAPEQFVTLFAHLEVDVVDLLVATAKGFLECREQLDLSEGLRCRLRTCQRGNFGWKDIDAGRRGEEGPEGGPPDLAVEK